MAIDTLNRLKPTIIEANRSWNKVAEEIKKAREEKKIPEKLPFESGKISDNEFLAKYITHNRNAINEIIDYLKSKGDE